MTGTKPISRHPSTGELVRQLDGELAPEAEARVSRHLDRCDPCRAKALELREHSRLAGEYVRGLATGELEAKRARERTLASIRVVRPERSRYARSRVWAAAAAVAGLVVLSLGVDPLRAWMSERLAALSSPAAPLAAPPVALPSSIVGAEGSVIAFEPVGTTFDLSIEHAQAEGRLFLQVRDLDRATAQVTSAADETILILPSGLRIENGESSRASYRVTLPPTVREIAVRVGDSEPRLIRVPGIAISWSETVRLVPEERP